MTSVFIARQDIGRVRAVQSRLQAARDLRQLGHACTVAQAQTALSRLDADALLVDLHLADSDAAELIRALRGAPRRGERPRVMLVAARVEDPALFSALVAGADAYLLERELDTAAAALQRLEAGEARIAAPIAEQVLRFFNAQGPIAGHLDDRRLDWVSHAGNPMQLSPGERRLLQLAAAGASAGDLALRFGASLEAVGRRVGNVYRKLGWDVRSGALSLQAA